MLKELQCRVSIAQQSGSVGGNEAGREECGWLLWEWWSPWAKCLFTISSLLCTYVISLKRRKSVNEHMRIRNCVHGEHVH